VLKLKEIAEPNSCLNRAADDEPIFVLKSTDPLASSIVRTWAIMYWKTKSAEPMGMTPKQRAKYEEAMTLASEMDVWHQAYSERTGGGDEHKAALLMAYDHAAGTTPPKSIDGDPLSAQDIVTRLCGLQASLYAELPNVETADCFCQKGGFWGTENYGGTFAEGYRNDGVALRFIEEAVREKLQRMDKGTDAKVTA
jgi:hypothetical protein